MSISSTQNGIVWVGDTARKNAIENVQGKIDSINGLPTDLVVRGFSFRPDKRGKIRYPQRCFLIDHYLHDRAFWNRPADDNSLFTSIIFNMARLRRSSPINAISTASFFMRYHSTRRGLVPNWEEPYQFSSAMMLHDLVKDDWLVDEDRWRDPTVLALVEQKSGLVLPLPSHSAIVWICFSDGTGIDLAVYDGLSLHHEMSAYPGYFDPHATLSDNLIDHDITNCLSVIGKFLHGVNPEDIKTQDLPPNPFKR